MVPVEAQDEKTKAWKSTDMSTMVPYADILTPFKTGMQTIITGKNPDQTSLDLYTRAFTDFIKRTFKVLKNIYSTVLGISHLECVR